MSFFYCTNCDNVFEWKYIKYDPDVCAYPCPLAGCDNFLFEIDEQMILPVKILNQKGYITEFSCSGHFFRYGGGYIKFKYPYDFPQPAPKGWYNNKRNNRIGYNIDENLNEMNRQRIILKKIKSLLDWVDSLPDIN